MSTESRVPLRQQVDLRGIPFFIPVDRDLYEKQKQLGRITAADEIRLQRNVGIARHYESIGTGAGALLTSFYGHFRARPRWGLFKNLFLSSIAALVGLQAGALAISATTYRTITGCQHPENVVLGLTEMGQEQQARDRGLTTARLEQSRGVTAKDAEISTVDPISIADEATKMSDSTQDPWSGWDKEEGPPAQESRSDEQKRFDDLLDKERHFGIDGKDKKA